MRRTTLGRSVMELSADFGGYLCRHIEEAVPGATAMWVNAALGDVSNAGATGEGFERPRSYGVAAAEVALDAVRSGQTLVQDRLEMRVIAYEEPIDNIAFVAAYLLGVLDGYYVMAPGEGVNAPTFAAHLRFGAELEMVTTPGESLTRNALPVVRVGCFVYTCRRLIHLSLIAGTCYRAAGGRANCNNAKNSLLKIHAEWRITPEQW